MPLWGTNNNAANSDLAVLTQMSKSLTSANQSALFESVSTGNGPHNNPNVIYGQFGVSAQEIQASPTGHGYHAGWVLRKEGTGGRAGRVTYETLVATNSIAGDGANDGSVFPDYTLVISTQPASTNGAANVTLTVGASSIPTGATLTYKWQRNPGSGWVDVPNTAGLYFNNTSPTLTVNAAIATGNTFRADVMAANSNTIYSANATVTTP